MAEHELNKIVDDSGEVFNLRDSTKQPTADRVTAWGSTPSDTKYPSEKLVKTSLDAKLSYLDATYIRNNAAGDGWVKLANIDTAYHSTVDIFGVWDVLMTTASGGIWRDSITLDVRFDSGGSLPTISLFNRLCEITNKTSQFEICVKVEGLGGSGNSTVELWGKVPKGWYCIGIRETGASVSSGLSKKLIWEYHSYTTNGGSSKPVADAQNNIQVKDPDIYSRDALIQKVEFTQPAEYKSFVIIEDVTRWYDPAGTAAISKGYQLIGQIAYWRSGGGYESMAVAFIKFHLNYRWQLTNDSCCEVKSTLPNNSFCPMIIRDARDENNVKYYFGLRTKIAWNSTVQFIGRTRDLSFSNLEWIPGENAAHTGNGTEFPVGITIERNCDLLEWNSIANGGTGATTAIGAEYNILNQVADIDTTINGDRKIALCNQTKSASNGVFRWLKLSNVWTWIKGLLSSESGVNISGSSTSCTGNAATATTAITATNYNTSSGTIKTALEGKRDIYGDFYGEGTSIYGWKIGRMALGTSGSANCYMTAIVRIDRWTKLENGDRDFDSFFGVVKLWARNSSDGTTTWPKATIHSFKPTAFSSTGRGYAIFKKSSNNGHTIDWYIGLAPDSDSTYTPKKEIAYSLIEISPMCEVNFTRGLERVSSDPGFDSWMENCTREPWLAHDQYGAGSSSLPVYVDADNKVVGVDPKLTQGNLIRSLDTWSNINETDEYIPVANNSATAQYPHGRYSFAKIWSWIKGKLTSDSGVDISGNAATASAAKSGSALETAINGKMNTSASNATAPSSSGGDGATATLLNNLTDGNSDIAATDDGDNVLIATTDNGGSVTNKWYKRKLVKLVPWIIKKLGTRLVYDCGTGSTSTTDFNNAVSAFNAGQWVIIHSSSGVYYCVGTYSGGLRFKKLSNEASLLKVDTITWNSGSAPTAGNQIEASLSGHTHGNVTSDGKLQTDAEAIGSGDSLVVTDYSNSAKIARTSVTFDGTTTTKALTPKGTWETFVQDVSGKMNTNAGNAASGALQNLTGQLTEGTSDFTDKTEIFTSYAGNSGFAESGHVNQPYRRKASSMLNYIESKRFYERNPADNSVGTDTKRIQLGYGAYGSGYVGYCCYIVHIFFNLVGGSLQGKGVTLLVNYDWRDTQYQNAKCQILSDNGLIDAGYQIVLANFKSDNNSKVHVCLGLVSTSAPTTLVQFAYSYCKIFRLCSGLNWTHSIASDNVGSYNDLIPSEYVKAISIGNANVGNANQPVYFSNGVPVACNWWVS